MIVEHLDRMSQRLQDAQETVTSLRRMLAAPRPLAVEHREEPATTVLAIRGHVDGGTVVSWWLDAFTELHRLLRSHGIPRTGPDGAAFPTEFFTEGAAELVAFVPVERTPTLTGRVEVLTRPAQRYAVAVHEGPMVDLDGAYAAVGQALLEQALSTDGPVVERYQPLGDEDDLLAHRTEVCWPSEAP